MIDNEHRRRSRGGVFRLNSGATSFGRRSSLPLNSAGGSFMSGRTAGGGAGAGDTLARALAMSQPERSVQGPAPEVGPPIATPSPVTQRPDDRPLVPHLPSFTPPTQTSAASQLPRSLAPSFQPIVQPIPPRVRYF